MRLLATIHPPDATQAILECLELPARAPPTAGPRPEDMGSANRAALQNKSHSVTAEIVVPEKGAEGVIIAQGANIGSWSLYAKGGKLEYCCNYGGFSHYYVEGSTPIPAGEHQVCMEFAYDGCGLGKGGKVTLYTDGKKVGEGVIGATLAMVFSTDGASSTSIAIPADGRCSIS
jgi:hypothetical protein